jgi:hypothetical protein
MGEADGAGLVWRAVNKLGSLVSDLGDVAGGCSNGEVMKYQTSNSTWICGTDSTGSGISNIVSAPATTAKLIQDNSTSSTKVSLKTLTQGTGITITNGTSEITIASSVVDTDTTNIVSAPATTAKLIQDNSTSSSKVSLKTLTQGTGITITNGTSEITIASSVVDTDTTMINSAQPTDAKLIQSNATDGVTLKTLTMGSGIILTNNTSDIMINASNPYVLSGGNLTSVTVASYLTIFDIPLTADSGNFVSVYLIADSDVAGTAIQVMTNTTGANNWGNCFYTTPTTATAQVVDQISVTAGTDTGETNNLTPNPVPIMVQCAIYSTSSPGNLKIGFQPDATNSRVTIMPGSYYIKTP